MTSSRTLTEAKRRIGTSVFSGQSWDPGRVKFGFYRRVLSGAGEGKLLGNTGKGLK